MIGRGIRRGREIKRRIEVERLRGVGILETKERDMGRIRKGERGGDNVLLLQSRTMILVKKRLTTHHPTSHAVATTAVGNEIKNKIRAKAKVTEKDKIKDQAEAKKIAKTADVVVANVATSEIWISKPSRQNSKPCPAPSSP